MQRTGRSQRYLAAWLCALLCAAPAAPAQTRPRPEGPATGPTSQAATAPDPAQKEIDLALKYRKSRRFEPAIAALQRALQLKPASTTAGLAHFELGQSYFARAKAAIEGKISNTTWELDLRKAVELFGQMVKAYPKHEKAKQSAYMVGSSYLLLEDYAKALQAYTLSFQGYSDAKYRAKSLLRMGVCQGGLDQPRKALLSFTRLLKDFASEEYEVKKARKYLREMALVGRPAPKVYSDEWLFGLASGEGLQTFEEQVVVVVFFATWCNHCSNNMPRLRTLIQDWSAQGVVFLGIANPDDPMNTELVDVYVQQKGIEFHDVALDRRFASWKTYRVTGLPAVAVIDRKGIVRWRGDLAFLPSPLLEKINQEG